MAAATPLPSLAKPSLTGAPSLTPSQPASAPDAPPPGVQSEASPGGWAEHGDIPADNDWLELRDCRVGREVLPLVLLHPRYGIAIRGGTPEAPVLLRQRLDKARFGSIFAGVLPVVRWETGALNAAFAKAPRLTLAGGDSWISTARRALESEAAPGPPVRLGILARRRRRNRRLILAFVLAVVVIGGTGLGLALLPAMPEGRMAIVLPAPPRAVPPPEGPAVTSGSVPVAIPALPAPAVPATPGSIARLPAADQLPDAPQATVVEAVPPPVTLVPAPMPVPPAAAMVEAVPPPAAPDSPLRIPSPPALAPSPMTEAAPPVTPEPVTPEPVTPEPVTPPAARPRLATPRPAPAVPEPQEARLIPSSPQPAAAARCRHIAQRMQIGDSVSDGDIRFLQRGCPD
ncbi:MAG: hypothetical protein JWP04_1195 [Belnapia sp.]|nr:hypothetical protein [Belnapia sp.]